MAPAPPTCAGRIVRSQILQNGWGQPLSPEINKAVNKIRRYAKDCYVFQLTKERPVDASSLSSALFWEHRHLLQPRIVSTPAANYGRLFCTDKLAFKNNLDTVRQERFNNESVEFNALFGPMRDREFIIWPVYVPVANSSDDDDTYWITLFMRVQPREPTVDSSDNYLDREVAEIAIIDPLARNRDSRKKFVERKLGKILAQGGIEFSDTAVRRDLQIEDTADVWTSGYISYAISREILRRLRVLIHRRQSEESVPTDFLWERFEETYNFGTLREGLMAACAHQAIEKSGYVVRMVLDVPSDKTNHNPSALNHLIKGNPGTSPLEDVLDEDYTDSSAKVHVQITEGIQFTKKPATQKYDPDQFTSDSDDDASHHSSTHSASELPDYEDEFPDTSMADSKIPNAPEPIQSPQSPQSLQSPQSPSVDMELRTVDQILGNSNMSVVDIGSENKNEHEQNRKHSLEDISERSPKRVRFDIASDVSNEESDNDKMQLDETN